MCIVIVFMLGFLYLGVSSLLSGQIDRAALAFLGAGVLLAWLADDLASSAREPRL